MEYDYFDYDAPDIDFEEIEMQDWVRLKDREFVETVIRKKKIERLLR